MAHRPCGRKATFFLNNFFHLKKGGYYEKARSYAFEEEKVSFA